MGDWRKPRGNLTKHERGIPKALLVDFINSAGLKIEKKIECDFSPFIRLVAALGGNAYSNSTLVMLDRIFSKTFSWNYSYHAIRSLEKVRPASVAFVLEKPL